MKLKKLLSVILSVIMLVSVLSVSSASAAETESVETSAPYYYEANSMYALKNYLLVAGECTIKLTDDCICSHKVGAEGHTALSVYGKKTIDLNGYEIICNDDTNVAKVKHNHPTMSDDCIKSADDHQEGDCLIKVEKDSFLTINDSSGGKGRIHYNGKSVGYTKGGYSNNGHFIYPSRRDVFIVEGTLILNDGKIEAGREEKYYFMNSSTEGKTSYNGNGFEQIHGTAAHVLDGGKFIVNGGIVSGLGKPGDSYITDYYAVVQIYRGGKVVVNDGKLSALGCADLFGGKGVDGGLYIAGGIFAIDKHDKIRISDIIGTNVTLPGSDVKLWYACVTNGTYGAMGIPDSAWKNKLGHRYVEVHELESDKYYTYRGWKDSDFNIDLTGNKYKEVAICGSSMYNTDAVFLQGTYGSTSLGKKSIFQYYPDTADKFRVTYDYESDPFFIDGNTTLTYEWKIWDSVKDDTPEYQATTSSATINPIKPSSTVDFSGKIIYVECTVKEVSNYNPYMYYINTTASTYIEPTTSMMGLLEFKDQNPPMDRYSTTANIYGALTGDTFSFSFNNVPLPAKYVNQGYKITRAYQIYESGMDTVLLKQSQRVAGTNSISDSFVPTKEGLYTIYENLFLEKNGTTVLALHNLIYLSVEDSYQVFDAHATVEVPVHGMLPDFEAFTDTEHVKILDVDWSKKHDNGEYYLMDDGETFVSGQSYECIVVFEAIDDYKFTDTPTGTINGIDRLLFNHDEKRAAFGVRFKCPISVPFAPYSKPVVGGTLEVDIETMAEFDDELMEAYFNDEVTYKWFCDGRLHHATKSNVYEIPKEMTGHYIAVKVCYGDKSIASEEFKVEAAKVEIMLGDANNDNTIDVNDVTAMQMYIAQYDIEINEEALDVNGDGTVDVNDATTLQMILAGYDI